MKQNSDEVQPDQQHTVVLIRISTAMSERITRFQQLLTRVNTLYVGAHYVKTPNTLARFMASLIVPNSRVIELMAGECAITSHLFK